MTRQIYLSDGSNFWKPRMFPLLDLPQQKIYYILSHETVSEVAEAYISVVKDSIPNASDSTPWEERVKLLHYYFDHLDAMRNFLATHHNAEFYAK